MDKQKQIEEMAELMASWALQNNMLWHEGHAKALAETFVENDYGKIPEGAVMVTKSVWEEHIEQRERTMRVFEEYIRKETAERFAEKARLKTITVLKPLNGCVQLGSETEEAIFLSDIDKIAKEITEGE